MSRLSLAVLLLSLFILPPPVAMSITFKVDPVPDSEILSLKEDIRALLKLCDDGFAAEETLRERNSELEWASITQNKAIVETFKTMMIDLERLQKENEALRVRTEVNINQLAAEELNQLIRKQNAIEQRILQCEDVFLEVQTEAREIKERVKTWKLIYLKQS